MKNCIMERLRILSPLILCLALFSIKALAQEADLSRLSESGFIMGPGSDRYKISPNWKKDQHFMKAVDVFDSVAERIEGVICGSDQNKSILVVGEPSLAYRYLFARLAGPRPNSACPSSMWHVELNVNKVEAGHKYVGEVDEYWERNVLAPTAGKNVVLYISALGSLVGIGSHEHDDSGIEREYVTNITSGQMRSVAFMDKFEYNEMARSKNAYVLEAFADRVILPPIESEQTFRMASLYLERLYPKLTLLEKDLQYIIKQITYYQPNRNEPDRTFSVLNSLLRGSEKLVESKPENLSVSIESEHPYPMNSRLEYLIEQPGYNELSIDFDSFDLESNKDFLEIYDGKNNVLLGKFTGKFPDHKILGPYSTDKLKLVLITNDTIANQGFKISKVIGKKEKFYTFKREEVRKALFAVAQVPQWMVDHDFSVIKNLEKNLNDDVVGVAEGKRDLVRLAKNGYVAGRTDDKPIATVLLAGPTGTGKSYIAKKMADFMGLKMITLDMTNYKEVSSFRSFQEIMARNLTNNPYAVYLFEEIDKAAMEILDQLYFMMDEGVFYDPYQRPLFARGAFIIMTTNAASETILKDPNNPDLRSLVMADLKKNFRMSFLNRFDAVSIFKPFSDLEFHQLAKILVSKKLIKIKETFEWQMNVDQATVDFLALYGRSPEFGARPMERLVENTLGIGIAEYQLAHGAIPENSEISIAKLSAPYRFKISVGNNSLEYEVDPSNNGRIEYFKGLSNKSPLGIFFEANRLYKD